MGSFASDHHLRLTRRFIEENPSVATVKRRTRSDDGEGGYALSDVDGEGTHTLDLNAVRLVQRRNLGDQSVRITPDGRSVVPTYIVVAMPDESIKEEDVILLGGQRYEVVFVSRSPQWRLSAEVVEFRG